MGPRRLCDAGPPDAIALRARTLDGAGACSTADRERRGAHCTERSGAICPRRNSPAQGSADGVPRISQLSQRRAACPLPSFDARRPRRASQRWVWDAHRIRRRSSPALGHRRHRFVALFAANRRGRATRGRPRHCRCRAHRFGTVAACARRIGAPAVRGGVAVVLPFAARRACARRTPDGGDRVTRRARRVAPACRARSAARRNPCVLAPRGAEGRPMSHLIHRNLRAVPPTAVGASGIGIVDRDGRRYIDASGGAAVSCLGHAHPHVLAAMHAQIERIAYAHTSFFTTDVAETLADTLAADAPNGLDQVYLVSGGSEAIEAALKLARQYFVEIGQPERRVFIARRQSYHGNTLGALSVGGNEWRRREFAPLLIDVARVSPCFEYRERHSDESQDAYTDRLIAELEAIIEALDPRTVIAFCAETVVGATAGAGPPTPG